MDGASPISRRFPMLLACCCAVAGWLLAARCPAQQAGVKFAPMPNVAYESCPVDGPTMITPPTAPEGFAPIGLDSHGADGPWDAGPSPRHWLVRQLDLRHSSTHGRAMGPGEPLRGTSWLNRPFAFSLDGGVLLMGDRVAPHVRPDNDLFGAVGLTWDWDHYWGSQVRLGWATPDLLNTLQTGADSNDNLFISDLSMLYYPWGDSRTRPYYRLGVGLTDVEYTNDFGQRIQANLLTIPFGVGLKYQLRRDLAWRLELMDNFAFGQNETNSLNNLTITFGLEWRLGGRPDSEWGYAPRSGAW